MLHTLEKSVCQVNRNKHTTLKLVFFNDELCQLYYMIVNCVRKNLGHMLRMQLQRKTFFLFFLPLSPC